ncbi:MAG: DUF2147 domain-containing protein [Gammaproteobacteria bacterium]|nr:DUF2147 domain-containing protein [Gammaproteobacteria bacterium]
MIKYLVLIIGVFYMPTIFAQGADDVIGEWSTPEEKSRIEIYKCGDRFCGKIVWLKKPNFESDHERAGQAKTDLKNPDPTQHDKPLIGLQIMKGFAYEGDRVWEDGEIYDPENGKTYSCKMTLENDRVLNVRGYIGISLIGRTTVWTR